MSKGSAAPATSSATAELKQFEATQRATKAEDAAKLWKARAEAAERRQREAERLRESVFNLQAVQAPSPGWTLRRSDSKHARHTSLLVSSDLQWGEVISKENMDGLNEFNVAIAEQRYRLAIDRAIDISLQHLPKNKYDGFVYLRLGDQVSGDIHQELRETNELSSIPAVRSLVACETWGLGQLADAFGKVHVISVPGNHGRTTLKPQAKRVQDNYDTLSAWWLESIFRKDTRITWQTPNSTDAVFALYGRLYLATHGDRIGSRGGQGFIGPAATIMRGMKKVMDEYARRGTVLSKCFVGHFHMAYFLGLGWSNGSLPGYSEFARDNRMTPEPPIWWLLQFHPRYGATSQWPLLLSPELAPASWATPFAAA